MSAIYSWNNDAISLMAMHRSIEVAIAISNLLVVAINLISLLDEITKFTMYTIPILFLS